MPLLQWFLNLGINDLIAWFKARSITKQQEEDNANKVQNLKDSKTLQEQQDATNSIANHLGEP